MDDAPTASININRMRKENNNCTRLPVGQKRLKKFKLRQLYQSFKKGGISNVLDGMEDDLLYEEMDSSESESSDDPMEFRKDSHDEFSVYKM